MTQTPILLGSCIDSGYNPLRYCFHREYGWTRLSSSLAGKGSAEVLKRVALAIALLVPTIISSVIAFITKSIEVCCCLKMKRLQFSHPEVQKVFDRIHPRFFQEDVITYVESCGVIILKENAADKEPHFYLPGDKRLHMRDETLSVLDKNITINPDGSVIGAQPIPIQVSVIET